MKSHVCFAGLEPLCAGLAVGLVCFRIGGAGSQARGRRAQGLLAASSRQEAAKLQGELAARAGEVKKLQARRCRRPGRRRADRERDLRHRPQALAC